MTQGGSTLSRHPPACRPEPGPRPHASCTSCHHDLDVDGLWDDRIPNHIPLDSAGHEHLPHRRDTSPMGGTSHPRAGHLTHRQDISPTGGTSHPQEGALSGGKAPGPTEAHSPCTGPAVLPTRRCLSGWAWLCRVQFREMGEWAEAQHGHKRASWPPPPSATCSVKPRELLPLN